MNEDYTKDPRDLDGDGKVTLNEKLTYIATEASEQLDKLAQEATVLADKALNKAGEAIDKACDTLKEKHKSK